MLQTVTFPNACNIYQQIDVFDIGCVKNIQVYNCIPYFRFNV